MKIRDKYKWEPSECNKNRREPQIWGKEICTLNLIWGYGPFSWKFLVSFWLNLARGILTCLFYMLGCRDHALKFSWMSDYVGQMKQSYLSSKRHPFKHPNRCEIFTTFAHYWTTVYKLTYFCILNWYRSRKPYLWRGRANSLGMPSCVPVLEHSPPQYSARDVYTWLLVQQIK
jgi:hypothetical protein